MTLSKKIQILNYGIGNIKSIYEAIRSLGHDPIVDVNVDKSKDYELLIIPGVGSFEDGIEKIEKLNLRDKILEYAERKKKILGICLGMQLFLEKSEEINADKEGKEVKGLGLIKGNVKKFTQKSSNQKLPNINWSTIKFNNKNSKKENSNFFENIEYKFHAKQFYFMHSYFCDIQNDNENIASSKYYDQSFCAICNKGNIFGFQFHPEKSRNYGLELISEIILKS